MGCDIHLYTEIKIDGDWHCYTKCNVDRDYGLFEKMAGVRGYSNKSISPPKGLPKNLSLVVSLEAKHWGGDGHSHSWLNLEEIKLLEIFVEKQIEETRKNYPKAGYDYVEKRWGYLGGNSYGGFEKKSNSYPKGIEDVRFVFWFDN